MACGSSVQARLLETAAEPYPQLGYQPKRWIVCSIHTYVDVMTTSSPQLWHICTCVEGFPALARVQVERVQGRTDEDTLRNYTMFMARLRGEGRPWLIQHPCLYTWSC